jgi:serine/threonine-protein kinase HipA
MAPLYDAVTTRVFPRLKLDRMALKLNGKDDQLRRVDFRALASTAGMRAGDVDVAIDDMVDRMKTALNEIALPTLPHYGPDGEALAARMLEICRKRVESFA